MTADKLIRLSADLSVDAVEYASRANAILGIRDSGKTYTGTLIAEQLFDAGIPFFAFDPIGLSAKPTPKLGRPIRSFLKQLARKGNYTVNSLATRC